MLLGDKGRSVCHVTNAPGGSCGTGGGADTGWGAVINADRAYYGRGPRRAWTRRRVIAFPPYCPEQRVPIRGE